MFKRPVKDTISAKLQMELEEVSLLLSILVFKVQKLELLKISIFHINIFQHLLHLRLKQEVKLLSNQSQLCCHVRLKEKNQLAFFGT